MNTLSLLSVSFAMSVDAFTASLTKGPHQSDSTKWLHAIKVGLIFGIIEGITPILGWLLGHIANRWIEQWDHWIAFSLLTLLGLKVLYEAIVQPDEPASQAQHSTPAKKAKFYLVILTAFATSIDAMTIGVTFAFLNVNIWLAAFLIGLFTTIMATLGTLFGHYLSLKIGKFAEILGGIILIVIGSSILYQHLMA